MRKRIMAIAGLAAAIALTACSGTPSLQSWLDGAGGTHLTAVKNDLDGLAANAQQEDLLAMGVEGIHLAADAKTAAADPPPVDPAGYTAAMNLYSQAGTDVVTQQYTQAAALVSEADADLAQVVAAAGGSL